MLQMGKVREQGPAPHSRVHVNQHGNFPELLHSYGTFRSPHGQWNLEQRDSLYCFFAEGLRENVVLYNKFTG